MRSTLLTLISAFLLSTLFSSICFASFEDEWNMMLNGLEASAPSETAVIDEQIARIEGGLPRNPLAGRPKGPASRVPGTTEATKNERWLLNSHQGLYTVYCSQNRLSKNCSSSGSNAAHRDLNAIQQTMTLAELKARLVYLNAVAKQVEDMRNRQRLVNGSHRLAGQLLTWDAVPHQSTAKYAVPTHIGMRMPGTAVAEATSDTTIKILVSGEKRPVDQPDHTPAISLWPARPAP